MVIINQHRNLSIHADSLLHEYVYVCMYECMYVLYEYMYVCLCMYVYVCTYAAEFSCDDWIWYDGMHPAAYMAYRYGHEYGRVQWHNAHKNLLRPTCSMYVCMYVCMYVSMYIQMDVNVCMVTI